MATERTDAALRDLEEIEAQRNAGLLDDTSADRLWARYAREALEHADDAPQEPRPETAAPGQGSSPWARRLGVMTFVAAVVGVVTVGLSTGERGPGGFVTGNEPVDSVAGGGPAATGRDLWQVTNAELEEVVAQNPDVVAMRARLAHRYLDDGELDRAVDHYLEVLDRDDHPEAMSHLGWILFGQGQVDLAAPLLEESRRLDPQDPEAMWFQANLLLDGRGEAAPAVPLLEGLLRRDDLGGPQRSDVEEALRDAQQRIGGDE